MLSLSHSVGYAIQALACLKETSDEARQVREIARETGVPAPYLAKLLKKLVDAGIVASKRGYKGGTWLNRPAAQISLLEISEAIEGRKWVGRCLLGLENCSERRACPTHDFCAHLEKKLGDTNLAAVITFEAEKVSRPPSVKERPA